MNSGTFASASHSASAPPPQNWSEDQLIRVEYEWRQLQRGFAYHPNVRVTPILGDPPSEYQIEYTVRTLSVNESGQLEYADTVTMHVVLPPGFPYEAPSVQPVTAVFHPNVSWEGVHLSTPWQPTDTLIEYIRKIGELLAWRVYDPEAVINTVAMDWLDANAGLLPMDATADFSVDAGDEPLTRICRFGPATLDQIHKQLSGLRDSMLEVGSAPGPTEVREFSRRTRMSLNLFMDAEIPQDLRDDASQLDHWARELPGSVPVWDFLRHQRGALRAARSATTALSEKREPLLKQINALEALAPAKRDPSKGPQNAQAVLAAIPDAKSLESLRLGLPAMVRETEQLLLALAARVKEMDSVPPALPMQEDSSLTRQLQTEMENESSARRSAQESAAKAVASVQPVLERAQIEARALVQIAEWREYLDLIQNSRELQRKLAMWGAAGIHAYYIENESGRFGPFQFEQPLELDGARIAVRSPGRNRIRVIDVMTTERIGASENGTVAIKLPGADGAPGRSTNFRLTDRWEDLAIQFDFLLRQTGHSLTKLTSSFPSAPSWCGDLLRVLALPVSLGFLRQQHRKASHQWKLIFDELQALGPVKSRIESWNFVGRVGEAVPHFLNSLAMERERLRKCTTDLASIVSRCGRDMDTDTLIIPPKLATPYSEQVKLRDRTHRTIVHIESVLAQLGQHVTQQLSNLSLVGSCALPEFSALPAFPPEMAESISALTDAALLEQVAELERLLDVPLRGTALEKAAPGQPGARLAAPAGSATPPEAGTQTAVGEAPIPNFQTNSLDEDEPDVATASESGDSFVVEHNEDGEVKDSDEVQF